MGNLTMYSVISSLLTTPLAFIFIFLLTDQWRYPLKKMLRIAVLFLLGLVVFYSELFYI